MIIVRSDDLKAARFRPDLAALAASINPADLRRWVSELSFPRHYTGQPEANARAGEWVCRELEIFGYRVQRHGRYQNVIALPQSCPKAPLILVGAHYDSVADTPGADDNASAVAAMLGCAKALAPFANNSPLGFVSFNREEDGLLGSRDFVQSWAAERGATIGCAHILEMVGFTNPKPGGQHIPSGLPIQIPETGDFLGLLANANSALQMNGVLEVAHACLPGFPVIGLKVVLGAERMFPVLARSDHVPFWDAGIPAVMWTDTSEFRNPHYHKATDLPETLDYNFLRRVTQLLSLCAASSADIQIR